MTNSERNSPDTDSLEFEGIVLPHLPDVARYARSLTRDRGAADDLVQETYLRAYRGRSTYQPESDARRWLFAICRHEFLRTQRREQRMVGYGDEPELEALAAAGLHVAAKRDGFEQLFTEPDIGPAIARAMSALPEIHRTIVAMVDMEGLSYGEAADSLGVPIGTIRSRLFRGRRVLAEALIEHARDAGLAPRATNTTQKGAT
ncbi:MAG: RNA polymerase sigma factor [Gemmatimonadaceae bacterium]